MKSCISSEKIPQNEGKHCRFWTKNGKERADRLVSDHSLSALLDHTSGDRNAFFNSEINRAEGTHIFPSTHFKSMLYIPPKLYASR